MLDSTVNLEHQELFQFFLKDIITHHRENPEG